MVKLIRMDQAGPVNPGVNATESWHVCDVSFARNREEIEFTTSGNHYIMMSTTLALKIIVDIAYV